MSPEPAIRPEGEASRELTEKIRTLERLNADLAAQITHLSGTLFMTDMEKRRLERRYLVVRPMALMRKVVFLYKQRRERKRLG